MAISNEIRFETMDFIFTHYIKGFYVERVTTTPIYKEYNLSISKDNQKEMNQLLDEINAMFNNDREFLDSQGLTSVMESSEYNSLSEKFTELSKETVCVGTIKNYFDLKTKEIKVVIDTKKETKEFVYDEDTLMEDLTTYLDELSWDIHKEY